MANLVDAAQWEASIYSIANNDAAEGATLGSPNTGIINQAALKLANRTKYLKAVVDSIGLPVFSVHGKGYCTWDSASNIILVSRALYHSSIYNTQADTRTIQKHVVISSYGISVIEQAFRMPYNFTKLTLTFLGKNTFDVSSSIVTTIIEQNATSDTDNFVSSNISKITTAILAADPVVRTVTFDLSAYAPGTPLTLLQMINMNVTTVSHFITFGQLRSSWGN